MEMIRLIAMILATSFLPTVRKVSSTELSLTEIEKPVPIASVMGLQGTTGVLPCDVTAASGPDDVFLILWFKDNATKPMYSLDVMGRALSTASQWADTSSIGRRSTFRTNSDTALLIDSITKEDEGMFRCRVDYKNSPTKNVKINFTVIVPPQKPVIKDINNIQLSGNEIGPLEVGEDLTVICEVAGGSPAPSVTWWKEGSIYDSSYEVTEYKTVINKMKYPKLRREDLGSKFVCQASNTNRTPPVSREIHISLNLPPTGLQVLEKPTYVSEGKSRVVTCQAIGGYPPPEITWWIGTRQLLPQQTKKEYQGVATSKLLYTPAIEDDGRYLTCRVLAKGRMKESLEDTWEIKVLYKPQVSLRLGKSLDPDNLRTGNDVYFECDVRANPIPHKLIWLHKGKQLMQNQDKGIVMSTQSLVLQKVGRMSRGEYECQAVNSEGTTTSNPVNLNIMFAPICKPDATPKLLGISFKKPSSILCEVEAYPSSVSFRWFFNNSEYQEWKDHGDFTQSGLKSQLEFLPKTSKDYGNLFCIGENAIGMQEEPCSFQIVPTGKPSPLTGCRIVNKTLTSLKVECHEGFDGGLPANFLLELYDAEKMELKSQVTNKVPIFEVSNIDPGVSIKLYLYAENAKGTSDPAIIDDSVPNQQKHFVEGVTDFKAVKDSSTSDAPSNSSSLPLIISSVCGVFILCASTLCIVITCRRKKTRSNRDKVLLSQTSDGTPYEHNNQEQHYGSNPDLIPVKNFPVESIPPQYCSDLDSTLLLGSQRTSVDGTVGKRKSQLVNIPQVPQIPSVNSQLQYCDTVSFLGNQAGFGPRPTSESIQSGTLDRNSRGQSHSYPLYHTCSRGSEKKKKVTIVENKEEESEV
eukprot:TRINITY_DN4776_c0_g2_i1.p1 TRINITY_DN4776_c0_g2~~TRINITY_DN4776_c0_g2_i1.p1  ORF type:complete len:861 (-),score=112.71 TRINITY_DN4776_c0_g2_i1:337-2919(-)